MYPASQPIDRSLVKAKPAYLNPDPIEVLEAFPGLQPTFFRLRDLFTDVRKNYLQGYYQAGVIVLEGCQDERVLREMQGDRPIKAWADALGISTRVLYECRRVAERFTRQEIEAIAEMQGVTWGHVCAVAVVSSVKERRRLLDMASEECLTVGELMGVVVPEKPRKSRGPGRAPGIPKDARGGLARVEKASGAFARQLREAWFCEQFDLADAITEIPPKKTHAGNPGTTGADDPGLRIDLRAIFGGRHPTAGFDGVVRQSPSTARRRCVGPHCRPNTACNPRHISDSKRRIIPGIALRADRHGKTGPNHFRLPEVHHGHD